MSKNHYNYTTGSDYFKEAFIEHHWSVNYPYLGWPDFLCTDIYDGKCTENNYIRTIGTQSDAYERNISDERSISHKHYIYIYDINSVSNKPNDIANQERHTIMNHSWTFRNHQGKSDIMNSFNVQNMALFQTISRTLFDSKTRHCLKQYLAPCLIDTVVKPCAISRQVYRSWNLLSSARFLEISEVILYDVI